MKRILIISVFAATLFACSQEKQGDEHAGHDKAKEESSAKKYTCPMHPTVVQDGPGKCPVCGMDLVPKTDNTTAATDDLMLTDSQIKLANITTQIVSVQSIGQTVVVNGKLVENQDLSQVVSSRAPGRVEKLFVKETGRSIQKGEPLYEIYSETILTLQREFLLAKEQYDALGAAETRYKSFLDAARRKLTLYGLSNSQVEDLAKNKNAQNRITFLSPASGIVTEISVSEGQYVSEGGSLMRIENTSSLWLEAELYPNEATLAKVGDKINVRISGFENQPVEAIVTFFSPEFRANTQIMSMRASISNPTHVFKPGMQAQVFFSHSSKKALSLPVDAVIRDGKGTHVYIQRGRNTFRPQMVKTGIEDFEKVEIIEGLTEGDTVAITGAYLLYSEIILKKGTDPMAGHTH
ncbi:MAG TPA: efflux RND transporter periplasmic adaptor subunit [Cyclobacteriaceae bacterium]|nr:efflux RND transporter periplasmic adaptor subunit [Cyclobacteriaceae bacterium]HMV07461.1 efflux RND transporter periplasmic adaptor subunit [Cyclobacteriaceae bacterium]HMW99184.1 efflux RND transporter periplasmic adaptor subunit [Cyclobacteriaceae bacterium]HMX48183.1 efflux RND transporter periplasmic adaptor subunit [Cyclobacteriaceae bacterium]HMY94988.1 efflux RND transporter periplasmic adaptor subunit [Cyclobacteriaceae bacterium]